LTANEIAHLIHYTSGMCISTDQVSSDQCSAITKALWGFAKERGVHAEVDAVLQEWGRVEMEEAMIRQGICPDQWHSPWYDGPSLESCPGCGEKS